MSAHTMAFHAVLCYCAHVTCDVVCVVMPCSGQVYYVFVCLCDVCACVCCHAMQWRGLRQGALLVGGVYFLSPLLKTLAATVSTDSVIALAVSAIIAHLFLHDYGYEQLR